MNMPALFFRYQLSPVKVRYTYRKKQPEEFIIRFCALIGGVFTLAAIISGVTTGSLEVLFGEKPKPSKS